MTEMRMLSLDETEAVGGGVDGWRLAFGVAEIVGGGIIAAAGGAALASGAGAPAGVVGVVVGAGTVVAGFMTISEAMKG